MNPPQLWLLVGGNGAGKTTFYRESDLSGLPFVNAGRLARRLSPDAPELAIYDAARAADDPRRRYLQEGTTFCAETVFSHQSKVDFVRDAVRCGFEVNLVYIHLPEDLHVARVSQRVSEGGHDVPAHKIVPRVFRLREHVTAVLPLCSSADFYDNSDSNRPFNPVLSVRDGQIVPKQTPLPEWAVGMTTGLEELSPPGTANISSHGFGTGLVGAGLVPICANLFGSMVPGSVRRSAGSAGEAGRPIPLRCGPSRRWPAAGGGAARWRGRSGRT